MNRSKHSIFNKLRKTMRKAVKKARKTFLDPEAKKDQDLMTKRELSKKFPKKAVKKKTKVSDQTTTKKKKVSKRTTPGKVTSRSAAPASVHKEGARWMKSTKKKISSQRKVKAHHGKK